MWNICDKWEHCDCFLRPMGLLPDTFECGLRTRRVCRERFPHHRLQRKWLVSDSGMYPGTCVTHVPWCMSGSLTSRSGENTPGILGACATRNVTYLVKGLLYWNGLPSIPGNKRFNQITLPFPNFLGWANEDCEWVSYISSLLMMDVIIYSCRD